MKKLRIHALAGSNGQWNLTFSSFGVVARPLTNWRCNPIWIDTHVCNGVNCATQWMTLIIWSSSLNSVERVPFIIMPDQEPIKSNGLPARFWITRVNYPTLICIFTILHVLAFSFLMLQVLMTNYRGCGEVDIARRFLSRSSLAYLKILIKVLLHQVKILN